MTRKNISNVLNLAMPAFTMLAALTGLPAAAQPPSFPSRPITIVVPFPPGGTADLLPRVIAPILTRAFGV